jgi:hypothetical protein
VIDTDYASKAASFAGFDPGQSILAAVLMPALRSSFKSASAPTAGTIPFCSVCRNSRVFRSPSEWTLSASSGSCPDPCGRLMPREVRKWRMRVGHRRSSGSRRLYRTAGRAEHAVEPTLAETDQRPSSKSPRGHAPYRLARHRGRKWQRRTRGLLLGQAKISAAALPWARSIRTCSWPSGQPHASRSINSLAQAGHSCCG